MGHKPCPICGNEKVVCATGTTAWVRCPTCGANGPHVRITGTEDEAISLAWELWEGEEKAKHPTEEELGAWSVTLQSFLGDVDLILSSIGRSRTGKLGHEMNLLEKYAKRMSELIDD